MYSTCLFCHHSLGKNEAIEHFPIGRRLAFDAAKGRLWVVCAHCARWNLTPIEERWEAVEDCERLFRGQRLRAQTDNVGLAKLPEGTDLIRIGSPLRPEFAAWRYGAVFRRRLQKRVALVGGAAAVAAGGAMLVAGAPIIATAGPLVLLPFAHLGIAAIALRGNVIGTRVAGEDGKPLQVTTMNLQHTKLIADGETIELQLRHSYGRQTLYGDRARRALGSILTRVNRGGGMSHAVSDAVDLITEAGDPAKAIARVAREAETRAGNFEQLAAEFARAPRGRTLSEALAAQLRMQQQRVGNWEFTSQPPANPGALNRLPRAYRLALEMSLHESTEQNALEQELSLLERDWREAEEIAAIADRL